MGLNSISPPASPRIGDDELALLRDVAAPIVLCPATRRRCWRRPGLAWLGVMLPATPCICCSGTKLPDGRRARTGWMRPATSVAGDDQRHPHGEPLVTGNDDELARLAGIADDAVIRCDDSVVRATPSSACPFTPPLRSRLRRRRSPGRGRADGAGAGAAI